MENENIVIRVESTHEDALGNKDIVKTFAKGKKKDYNNKLYVVYDEPEENGLKDVKTIIKFDGKTLRISRCGAIKHVMEFKAGENYKGIYKTPYGEITTLAQTQLLNYSEAYNVIKIYLEYILMLDDKMAGLIKLRILIGEDISGY